MARINIKTTVTAPPEVTVPLIRADYAETTNIFRVCFEVFLAVFSTVLGYVLAVDRPRAIHWVFLAVTGGATVTFAIISSRFSAKAHKLE